MPFKSTGSWSRRATSQMFEQPRTDRKHWNHALSRNTTFRFSFIFFLIFLFLHPGMFIFFRVRSSVQRPSATLSKYVFYSTCSFCLLCHLYPTPSRNSFVFGSFSIFFVALISRVAFFFCCALVPGTLALDLPTLNL